MKIKLKKIDKVLIYISTIFILLFLPIISTYSKYIDIKFITSNPATLMYIFIPFLIYIYIKNLIKTRKIDKFDILFYLLIIIGILASIFAIDIKASIFGSVFRHEGFLAIIVYNLLFINWKRIGNKNDIKNILKIIIGVAIINAIYALFQVYTDLPFIERYKDWKIAVGFCKHHNFFGTLIATSLGIMTCKFFQEKKLKILDLLIIFLLGISLINCQSFGPLIGYLLGICFIIFFLMKKNNFYFKKFIMLFIIGILFTVGYLYYENNYADGKCEICNINFGEIDNGRIKIWENSFDIVKENFITGVGYDNFIYAYPNPVSENENIVNGIKVTTRSIVDNAHNVYLNNIISNGIFGFIIYIILCILVFLEGLKSKDSFNYMLVSAFVVYSIQAFTNINVIEVTPIYYVIMGLILCENKKV